MPKHPLQRQEYPGLLIGAARRRIRQAITARVRAHGLSSQQFWVLVSIQTHPGSSLTELANRQRLDQPTASRVVLALTKRKLVRAAGHPEDRRRLQLWITPSGASLARKLVAIAEEVRSAVVEGMSPEELEALRAGLRKVIENMERFEQRHAASEAAEASAKGRAKAPRARRTIATKRAAGE
jgi:DNA-binding MarR family transcriptional regulator